MYIVTHKFTQHVKKNQFFFLRGIILPLSPLKVLLQMHSSLDEHLYEINYNNFTDAGQLVRCHDNEVTL
jgi:hypothetical protein